MTAHSAPTATRQGRGSMRRAAGVLASLLLLVTGCSQTPAGSVPETHALSGPVTATVAADALEPVIWSGEPRLPATVTDVQGSTVTVDDASRILALDLYGTTSRIVFELGLGDNVVGRDSSSTFEAIADRPLVTPSGHELNAEAILQLSPTLIITDTSLGPWSVIEQLRDAGVSVVVVDSHRSMDNVATITAQVGAALGMDEEAAELAAQTQARIDDAIARVAVAAPTTPPRVAFLYLRGQSSIYYLFGKGSGADSLIEALGAVDVASEAGVTGMKPMTDEAIVAAQPDVVLAMTQGLESVGGVDGLLAQIPALAQTPAGTNRRVIDMDESVLLSFGSATPAVIDALAVALYGVQP